MKNLLLGFKTKLHAFSKAYGLRVFFLVSFITVFSIALNFYLGLILKPDFESKISKLNNDLSKSQKDLITFQSQDQVMVNKELNAKIGDLEKGYKESVSLYEKLIDLKAQVKDTKELDQQYAQSVKYLSEKNYASAQAELKLFSAAIDKKEASLVPQSSVSIALASAQSSNTPPSSGFSQQKVTTEDGTFLVSIIAADMNNTRVIIDTASDGDCSNDCPALPLATYVSRSGAFAGINGSFFCPPEYPTCAGKTNSFDTLLMNKNKHYFNSSNNVYSTIPLVYFTGNSMGVRGQSLDWGRDTGVDGHCQSSTLYFRRE